MRCDISWYIQMVYSIPWMIYDIGYTMTYSMLYTMRYTISIYHSIYQPAGRAPKKGLGWNTVSLYFLKMRGKPCSKPESVFFWGKRSQQTCSKPARYCNLATVQPPSNSKRPTVSWSLLPVCWCIRPVAKWSQRIAFGSCDSDTHCPICSVVNLFPFLGNDCTTVQTVLPYCTQ